MIPRSDPLLLGVYREPEYCPGRHASNDAVILRLVGEALQRAGAKVELSSLADARRRRHDAALLFSMCQGPAALAELAEWKANGAVILNDPLASRRTYRDRLGLLLEQDGVPFPRGLAVPTDGSVCRADVGSLFRDNTVWVKRHDVHATCPDDVVRVEGSGRLQAALDQFRRRGLAAIVVQEHCPGDEVKFYGVLGGRFFWHFYPGAHAGPPVDVGALRLLAERAAARVGVEIYGGDAIVAANGHITLIDLNDWPSFAPCREAAAEAIAQCVLGRAIQQRASRDRVASPSSGIGLARTAEP